MLAHAEPNRGWGMHLVASLVVAVVLVAAPVAAKAQPAGKVYRIGVVWQTDQAASQPLFDAFRQGLSARGYSEGQNIIFEQRWAAGQAERLPALMADMVAQRVDVIVAPANPHIEVAKRATTTIPIVMVFSSDPVGAGFVRSLARPGGNITGLSTDVGGFEKTLELLREARPGLSQVALLGRLDVYQKAIGEAADKLHIAVRAIRVSTPADLDPAFARMKREGVEAVIVLPGPVTFAAQRSIAELALRYSTPSISGFASFVHAGGLMSFGPNLLDLARRAATYVDRILKGAKPADLPVEQPTKFEIVINLKTAKALGLTIPPSLLLRADQVIE